MYKNELKIGLGATHRTMKPVEIVLRSGERGMKLKDEGGESN
jgi:hypothetical protein